MAVAVRKASLKDAEAIANFVNRARPEAQVTRLDVMERFSQVGFALAEVDGTLAGVVGYQVENLVVRVRDFLIAPGVDRVAVGREMVALMEQAGMELQTEAAMLFLPENPSPGLIAYWQNFGYERCPVSEMLHRAWREAAKEWNDAQDEAMVKQLREDVTRKPL